MNHLNEESEIRYSSFLLDRHLSKHAVKTPRVSDTLSGGLQGPNTLIIIL